MNYLIKTRFGWGGITANKDVIKQVVLPSSDKALVLKRLGATLRTLTGSQSENPERADYADKDNTRCANLLKRYFEGKRVDLNRLRIDLTGFTGFERRVYGQLRRIPYGRTITYSELAHRAGVPNGARAVGNVMAKNPLPIIIPCHRVIRRNGAIGNFSAIGGVKLKEQLLKMEGAR